MPQAGYEQKYADSTQISDVALSSAYPAGTGAQPGSQLQGA